MYSIAVCVGPAKTEYVKMRRSLRIFHKNIEYRVVVSSNVVAEVGGGASSAAEGDGQVESPSDRQHDDGKAESSVPLDHAVVVDVHQHSDDVDEQRDFTQPPTLIPAARNNSSGKVKYSKVKLGYIIVRSKA